MVNDITPRTGLLAQYERDIEPRRLELAKHMGIYKKIPIQTPHVHNFVPGFRPGICYCVNCFGDFSGGDDEY